MIVIEGADASGKSTFINYIRNELGRTVVKPYYPKVNQLSYYLHSGSLYNQYILERYYLSEVVYPRFKANRPAMEDWQQYLIEASLYQYAPVIIYLRPERETIIQNIQTRGDDYISVDEVDRMLREYDAAIGRSFIPSIWYDYKKDDPEKIIQEATRLHSEIYEMTEYFHRYLSSGNCISEGGVMFIGDDPSNKSIGEGYIRAFISDKGSPAFLHRILCEAGVYKKEMPYFTNWGKGFDNEGQKRNALSSEIERLNPRKIICLGTEIYKSVDLPGASVCIEHPSYVKRFHSKNYQWYINKIKQLVNED
jgi:thymidylate kinase